MKHIEINAALTRFIEREVEVTQKLNLEQLSSLVTALIELRKEKGRVFVAGNGGSAATAEHFAIDIGIGTLNKNPGLEIECISLSSNLWLPLLPESLFLGLILPIEPFRFPVTEFAQWSGIFGNWLALSRSHSLL